MIKVRLMTGKDLKFPRAENWTISAEGSIIVLVPEGGADSNLGKKIAEIPYNNVMFVEKVEDTNA